MTIENYKTDINIDKALVNNTVESILLDKEILTGESLAYYEAFFNRFGDKNYTIENIESFEISRFTSSDVLEENIILDYNILSEEDKSIVNNFKIIAV